MSVPTNSTVTDILKVLMCKNDSDGPITISSEPRAAMAFLGAGIELHVLLGTRLARYPGMSQSLQQVVGARDMVALQSLNQMFYDHLELSGTIRPHLLPPELKREEVERLLDHLEAREQRRWNRLPRWT